MRTARFETALARTVAREAGRRRMDRRGPTAGERRAIGTVFALILVVSFALPLMTGNVAASDNTQPTGATSGDNGTASPGITPDAPPASLPASTTTYAYSATGPTALSLGTGTGATGEASPLLTSSSNTGSGGSAGNRLGNAPESHYRNLQKFLQKGKAPPANYPVPYVIYTNSSGVETFTTAFTKQPVSIDIDNNKATGQGGKDIRVKTEIGVNPLTMTTTVDRLGSPNPPDLFVSVTFPAFFYNGETNDPAGVPYWTYGYQTQPFQGIPVNVQMNFTVDHSVGTVHTFNFAWTSTSGIPHLGFEYGVFQVVDQNTTAMINPAFASFVVTSPPFAGLTFTTAEVGTASTKCMNWAAGASFGLSFGYDELRSLVGVDYPMNVTVQDVPAAFSICTTEDRAAHTYSLNYTASSDVAYADVQTQIAVSGSPTVNIDLTVRDMPSHIEGVLGDGSLAVTDSSPVGMVALNASATVGLANISSMVNLRMIIASLPSFTATWGQGSTGNFFDLETVTGCIGRIELAFSYGSIVLPLVQTSDPNSHYLMAFSNATTIAIALRLIGVQQIAFSQDNNVGSNTLTLTMCGNEVMYVLVSSGAGSLLTPNSGIELTVVMTNAPTVLSLTWTMPYVMSLTTNQLIASITADLHYTAASPAQDLTAHAEIDNLPATTMSWNIAASGSISFTAGSPIGTILLTATDPNGLLGAGSAFGGQPIRMLNVVADSVPSFTASWSSSSGSPPSTGVSFQTAPSTALGDLTFSISTDLTQVVTLLRSEANRGMLYSDDKYTVGMVSSLWLHVQDVTRAGFSVGGTQTTITAGFGTSVSHPLSLAAQIDPTSGLNPVPGRGVTALLVTTPLPTSMDLTVMPASGFSYTASGVIDTVTLDLTLGETAPNIDVIHGEIDGIPSGSVGTWSTGSFGVTLTSTLTRVLVTLDNDAGVLGSSLKHILVDVKSIPASVSASWDTSSKKATLSFTNPYSQGLGEFKLLATSGDVSPTNAYINSLSNSGCYTDYGAFTQMIDQHYWPSTVPSRLNSLYCRNPSLDTGANDYGVYRTGGGFDVYALRVRELGLLDLDLNSASGHVTVEFSRNVALSRQLYFISDDQGGDNQVVGDVSELPNGQPTNSFHAEWDQGAGHYAYALSQGIPYIDAYIGQHATTSLTSKYTKLLLVNTPETASFDYAFGNRGGHADFNASSVFEAGILVQDGSTRYVGYVQLQSLHFDYSFALPGEESCSIGGYTIDICYRIFRFDSSLNAVSSTADGVLGIYTLSSGLDPLTEGTTPRAQEYIPEWTFILDNFQTFQVHVKWDVGIGIGVGNGTIGVDVSLLPTITVVAGLNLVVDFFWNDQAVLGGNLPTIPLPVPGCIDTVLGATLTVNAVKDYVDQNPLHIWPVTGVSPITLDGPHITTSGGPSLTDPCNDWHITLTETIDIPGLHRFGDHPTPF